MSKTFRPWKIDEPLLLPVTVGEFVGKDHLARFVLGLIRDEVDLGEILACYGSEHGQPPYDPVMMTALLLYAYCSGIYSSRRIVKACHERLDFMCIVGLDVPDFRTISDFRKRHLKALGKLFGQVLLVCEKAGLVKLGHVAFDGTKIKANASKHKAMSYERMEKRAAELEAEVAKWLASAEAADTAEDKQYGRDKRGDAMPDWVADKQRRAAKIRQAKAELEAEAQALAQARRAAAAAAEQQREAEGRRKGGRKAAAPSPEPDAKAQRNFTDPESRIMKSKDGFVQAYNAQAAVDATCQVIVAHDVTQSGSDSASLLPMVDAVEANLGRKPAEASADAGYCSELNLAGLEERKIDAYVATGRARDAARGGDADAASGEPPASAPQAEPAPASPATASPQDCAASAPEPSAIPPAAAAPTQDKPTRVAAMRAKLKAGGRTGPYRLRKQLPEPVFGQIKQARGFRQFLMRGVETVRNEWALVCTAHNLLKLFQGRTLSAVARMAAQAA